MTVQSVTEFPTFVNPDRPYFQSNGKPPEDDIESLIDESLIEPDPPPSPLRARRTLAQLKQTLDDRAAQCTKQFLFDCINRGELGCADLLRAVAAGDLAYDRAGEQWYIWNGLHWEPDDGGNIYEMAGEVLSAVYRQTAAEKYAELLALEQEIGSKKPTEAQAAQASLLREQYRAAERQAKDLYKLFYVKNVLVFAGATEKLGLLGEMWDAQPRLLGVANGVIDLVTCQPVMPEPEQYIRTVAPIGYDPQVTCPLMDKSTLEIFGGNAETDAHLWDFLAYALSGECTEPYFYIWLGNKGQNGKEFILDRVRAVLGNRLAGSVEPELLLKSKSERTANSATPALMTLQGRRIAWASEINEGRTLDNATMKQLSGGHIITGRGLHQGQEEWKRTHTLFMLTNHKPHVGGGGDDAEWERIRLLEFPISFVAEPDPAKPYQCKRDATLGERIDRDELPGILNRLLAGILRYRQHGLRVPQAVKDDTAAYRMSEDTLGTFIEERCVIHVSARVEPTKLYQEYRSWCMDNGYGAMGSKTFSQKIEDRGYRHGKSGSSRFFNGIGLASNVQDR